MSDLKDFINEEYERVKDQNTRLYKEDEESQRRARNDWMRDYSRILYCSSFRRLQGKMQLIDIDGKEFHRNRLTHSLEVAQIARSMPIHFKEKLKHDGETLDAYCNEDSYVVEAGALAHDLGNPPFGHYGETVLNSLAQDFGGFDGNAQTLRILTTLEKKFAQFRGLNLTVRSLFSILKYFRSPEKEINRKFIYADDYKEIVRWVERDIRCRDPEKLFRTIDAQIVDLSDDIAYAVHDLEDAFSKRLFTVEEFLFEFKKEASESDIDFFQKIIDNARKTASKCDDECSSEVFGAVFMKEITSNLVHDFVNDIGVVRLSQEEKKTKGTNKPKELGFLNYENVVNRIKDVTFEMVNRKDNIVHYEKVGEKVITGLFEMLIDRKFNTKNKILPQEYREVIGEDPNDLKRSTIDYIAGMMDQYAIQLYEKYRGKLNCTYPLLKTHNRKNL